MSVLLGAFALPPLAHAHNDGAALCVWPDGVRYVFAGIAEPDSGALFIYLDTRENGTTLYAQRVDRHGRPMWSPGGVKVRVFNATNVYLDGYIPDGTGGILVCWNENRGATGNDVILQRVLPDGTLGFGPTGLVLCSATGDQGEAFLAPGPGGTFYALWKDGRVTGNGSSDLYAQRFAPDGSILWAANGIPVNSPTYVFTGGFGNGGVPSIAPDLAGNLLVTWVPDNTRIPRTQKVSSTGALMWGANGVEFGNYSDYGPKITADGVGGAWIAFPHSISTTFYAYLQHVTSGGALSFAATGLPTGMYGGNSSPSLLPMRNGSGGCFVYASFYLNQYGASVSRQEVNAAGTLLRGSTGELVLTGYILNAGFYDTGDGVAVAALPNLNNGRTYLELQRFGLDGAARYPGQGVILGRTVSLQTLYQPNLIGVLGDVTMVGFSDPRYSTPTASVLHAFGQALDATGNPLWDDSEPPAIQPVLDAPNDQGGYVRVRWDAGAADFPGAGVVEHYRVWRSVPGSLPQGAPGAQAATPDAPFVSGERTFMLHAGSYWEMVGEQPAAQLTSYAMTVPTGQDSVGGSPADEDFMVQAQDDSSHVWWSAAVTGHSVDNLAPDPLTIAAGHYAAGGTTLYWGGSSAADLCCYDVFRGDSPGFDPSEANRAGTTTSVSFTDAGPPAWYRIGARDIHGNLGGTVLVLPDGTTAVDPGASPAEWGLHARWRTGAHTLALSLAVPEAGEGTLAVYDVTGRRLWSAPFRTAGSDVLAFEVDGASAHLAPGMVFVRALSSTGHVTQARAIVLQ